MCELNHRSIGWFPLCEIIFDIYVKHHARENHVKNDWRNATAHSPLPYPLIYLHDSSPVQIIFYVKLKTNFKSSIYVTSFFHIQNVPISKVSKQ